MVQKWFCRHYHENKTCGKSNCGSAVHAFAIFFGMIIIELFIWTTFLFISIDYSVSSFSSVILTWRKSFFQNFRHPKTYWYFLYWIVFLQQISFSLVTRSSSRFSILNDRLTYSIFPSCSSGFSNNQFFRGWNSVKSRLCDFLCRNLYQYTILRA